MTAVAARARGLLTTVIAGERLAEIDRVRDATGLAAALARAGVPGLTDARAIDRAASERAASDFAVLARWTDALDIMTLDEDRRSLRAIVRGLAAGVSTQRRLAGTIATPRLPVATLTALASSSSLAELARRLIRARHPLAPVASDARPPVDPLAIELALAHRFAALARPRDRALRTHVTQVIDAENAAAALLLVARGGDIDPGQAFVAGGERLDRALFAAAVAGPVRATHDRLAAAFAGTPLEHALREPAAPPALEDAALAWQLATQARLRRVEPLGLAPAIYTVLRRRDEARHLRRAAWRIALGGGE